MTCLSWFTRFLYMGTKEHKYTFFGKVLPERADIHVGPFQGELKAQAFEGEFCVWVSYSQVTATFSSNKLVDDTNTLKNVMEHIVRSGVDTLGFAVGCGYDVEITSLSDVEGKPPVVYGVFASAIQNRYSDVAATVTHIFELFQDPRGAYLQRCLADLRQAIRVVSDSGFHCYRAIESLRQFFRIERNVQDDAQSWEAFRNEVNVNRTDIDFVKGFADPRRHGGTQPITSSDRDKILETTWNIVDKYVAYARNHYSKV